jgi:hypothetical protein
MIDSQPTLPKQQPHNSRFRPFTLAIVALLVGLGAPLLIAARYRSHVFWKYEVSRLGLNDVQAIPDRPLPESPTPEGWVRCRVGALEFSLPPELANNRITPKNKASSVAFKHGARTVIVAFPSDANEFSDFLNTTSHLRPQAQPFTMPRLRRECYQASSDDFRWSMTPEEVRWHAFCITTRNSIGSTSQGHTESFSRDDLDGILLFGKQLGVEWQSKNGAWGFINFIDREEKPDPTWIRAVCQSLQISNEANPEPQP